MRTSNDEYTANGDLLNGYDYARQCWVIDGKVAECGHPQPVTRCYSCNHAGETLTAPVAGESDLTIDRNAEGAWRISATVGGYLVTQTFYGYSRRESVALFLSEMKGA